MIGLNKIGLNQVQLNRLRLNAPFPAYGKMAGGGGSGDGFPQLPGDVTRWHFGGLTNEMMAAMDDPRIEDADGKGRFLSFKNFAWKGMSGVGGYADNFANWSLLTDRADAKITTNSFFISSVKKSSNSAILRYSKVGEIVPSIRIKVSGLIDGMGFVYMDSLTNIILHISKDGIYTLPSYTIESGVSYTSIKFDKIQESCNITIEQLPLYPGALVFDGVDDYGTCNNFPILTKEKGYTVVALRQWITRGEGTLGLISNVKIWFRDVAFILEFRDTIVNRSNKPISFGAIGGEMDLPHTLTYQTSKSYNGVSITTGSFKGTDVLHVGKLAMTGFGGNYSNAAIWEIVILDHDATEEELTKIKDYFVKTYPWLFPDQAWTVVGKTNEDEDRATIANITGNGNDLVLSNFGFAEGSGYGLYGFKFTPKAGVEYYSGSRLSFSKRQLDQITLNPYILIFPGGSYPKETDITAKIKVAGLKEGVSLIWGWTGNIELTITEDGTYSISAGIGKLRSMNVVYAEDFDPDHVVTIEQIPEYEGYLVTDGVDDKITSSDFKMGKDWTVVGDWKLINDESKNAGIIKPSSLYVYNASNGVSIFINSGSIGNNIKENKGFNAICSDGRAYDRNWTEYSESKVEKVTKSNSELKIGASSNDTTYTRMVFKNFAIYPKVLSKDDCIKAYNYLQTLKAK